MGYCTVSEVASEFKDVTFNSSSTVTDTEVSGFIDQQTEVIDARLSSKYDVPIVEADSPKSFKILKMICIWCVADRVRQIMQVKEIGDEKLKQGTRAPNSCKKAEALLEQILNGKLPLQDANLLSSADGFSGFASESDFDIHFKRSENSSDPVNQW